MMVRGGGAFSFELGTPVILPGSVSILVQTLPGSVSSRCARGGRAEVTVCCELTDMQHQLPCTQPKVKFPLLDLAFSSPASLGSTKSSPVGMLRHTSMRASSSRIVIVHRAHQTSRKDQIDDFQTSDLPRQTQDSWGLSIHSTDAYQA